MSEQSELASFLESVGLGAWYGALQGNVTLEELFTMDDKEFFQRVKACKLTAIQTSKLLRRVRIAKKDRERRATLKPAAGKQPPDKGDADDTEEDFKAVPLKEQKKKEKEENRRTDEQAEKGKDKDKSKSEEPKTDREDEKDDPDEEKRAPEQEEEEAEKEEEEEEEVKRRRKKPSKPLFVYEDEDAFMNAPPIPGTGTSSDGVVSLSASPPRKTPVDPKKPPPSPKQEGTTSLEDHVPKIPRRGRRRSQVKHALQEEKGEDDEKEDPFGGWGAAAEKEAEEVPFGDVDPFSAWRTDELQLWEAPKERGSEEDVSGSEDGGGMKTENEDKEKGKDKGKGKAKDKEKDKVRDGHADANAEAEADADDEMEEKYEYQFTMDEQALLDKLDRWLASERQEWGETARKCELWMAQDELKARRQVRAWDREVLSAVHHGMKGQQMKTTELCRLRYMDAEAYFHNLRRCNQRVEDAIEDLGKYAGRYENVNESRFRFNEPDPVIVGADVEHHMRPEEVRKHLEKVGKVVLRCVPPQPKIELGEAVPEGLVLKLLESKVSPHDAPASDANSKVTDVDVLIRTIFHKKRDKEGNIETRSMALDPRTREILVKKLPDGGCFQVSVRVGNKFGWSVYSHPILCNNLSLAPLRFSDRFHGHTILVDEEEPSVLLAVRGRGWGTAVIEHVFRFGRYAWQRQAIVCMEVFFKSVPNDWMLGFLPADEDGSPKAASFDGHIDSCDALRGIAFYIWMPNRFRVFQDPSRGSRIQGAHASNWDEHCLDSRFAWQNDDRVIVQVNTETGEVKMFRNNMLCQLPATITLHKGTNWIPAISFGGLVGYHMCAKVRFLTSLPVVCDMDPHLEMDS